jgi:hypothetical protein
MSWLNVDADTARQYALGVLVVGVVGVLIVLKFVSSLVSKLLLVALFGGMSWLGFSQRDDLSTCVTRITERARAGDVSDLTCSFFGRDVSVRIPSLPQEG